MKIGIIASTLIGVISAGALDACQVQSAEELKIMERMTSKMTDA